MHAPEIQVQVHTPGPLAEVLRQALGAEGRPPSRARIRAWIQAGRVRVDGRPVAAPEHALTAGQTVDLGPAPDDAPTGRAAPGPSEGLLHLDRHLLVVTWEPPVGTGPGDAVERRLRRALELAGVTGLEPRPVPDAEPRASGIVAAALSRGAEDALRGAFAAGDAGLDVVADVVDGDGRPDRLRVEGVPDLATFLDGLARRGVAVRPQIGGGAAAAGPWRLHVGGLRLPHPRTGRALAWRAPLPPAFEPDPQ